ncbi:TetR/AcrR family transcriptional regulator [Gulosibacter molinativorax]|uniref:HTH tetR-type domain-containing protein n=1 Tax=Gulosibacter molinativorax TaxID=256821 RepID=A0ABT7C8N1_9MICO|nr:TetR/AcrR family transcriptional regulator [Gulosibacter molinativorax]MDJ1370996.1 hypothetical protein [Gulosibacter molinativorax]
MEDDSAPDSKRAADPRPARTRAAIQDAVRRLAARPDQEISVNAIAREASVSRSAFYDQYSDLDALAIDMLSGIFRASTVADTMRIRRGDSLREAAEAATLVFLDYLDEHRAFFVSSLEWKTTSRAPEAVRRALADNYLEIFDVLGSAVPPGINRDDTALFLAGGTITLITEWMRESPPTPKREFALRLMAQHPTWVSGYAA